MKCYDIIVIGGGPAGMAAAIAATIASGPVTVLGAECVVKSYPTFWNVYQQLGGKYEQYLR